MTNDTHYDYIIVGGGTAGCVIASRLLEYKSTAQILVIEAGHNVNDRTDILHFQSLNFFGSEFDWGYKSVPQKNYDGRQVSLVAGRALGGSSVVNGCAWFRGAKADFDDWSKMVGDNRWSYEGQLPYFKMTENWYKPSDHHGHTGKMHIESPKSTGRSYPLARQVEDSWKELGIKPLPEHDMNGGTNIGLGEFNENHHKGVRQIASSTYSLEGIQVMTDTLVESVLLDDTSLSAIGVKLTDGTTIYSKETILSAGAYRTPQLLMLSGLGPKDLLEEHGIQTRLDLRNVGRNFNDHIMMNINWELKDPSQGYALGSDNALFLKPEFSMGIPADFVASTMISEEGLKAAIAKDEGTSRADPNHHLLKQRYALMENIVLYLAGPPHPIDGTYISTALMGMKPTSRGTISISSKDPTDHPLIDPNYLDTEVDKYVWREGLRTITKFMTGPTVLGREVISREVPVDGLEALSADASDKLLDSRMKIGAMSMFHASGSCAMGTVVDTELRVKGVKNLRVADASVFPIAIGAHTQAAVYAMAEQAAVIISQPHHS